MSAVKAFIADLARPYTFYSIATATAVAIVKMAWEITDGYQAAALAGVSLAGASAIYIGKAMEVTRTSAHAAELEKVKAQAAPQPVAEPQQPSDDAQDPTMYGGVRA